MASPGNVRRTAPTFTVASDGRWLDRSVAGFLSTGGVGRNRSAGSGCGSVLDRVDVASPTTGYAPVGNRCAACLAVSPVGEAGFDGVEPLWAPFAVANRAESRSTGRVTSDDLGDWTDSRASGATEGLRDGSAGHNVDSDFDSADSEPDGDGTGAAESGAVGLDGLEPVCADSGCAEPACGEPDGAEPGWIDPDWVALGAESGRGEPSRAAPAAPSGQPEPGTAAPG